jgi:hypothetical protein
MNTITFWLAAIFLALTPLPAQDASIITMDQEPHHHLALHNDFVKVFKVEVAPGDAPSCGLRRMFFVSRASTVC